MSTSPAPGPPASALLQVVRELKKDRVAFLERLVREYGEVVQLKLPGRRMFVLSNADHIQEVLQKRHRHYRKAAVFNVERKRGLGNSLLTNDGQVWLDDRRLVQPAFSTENLNALVPTMAAVAEAAVREWAPWASGGEEVELSRPLTRMTIQIASQTLFGVDLADRADPIIDSLGKLITLTSDRMSAAFKVPTWLPVPSNLSYRREMKVLDDVVYGVIARRRAGAMGGSDVLSRMLEARDPETKRGMSDKQLRDEVMTFLVAGHESTASGMAWTTYLLAAHPEVEQAVRAEVAEVVGDGALTAAMLPKLALTERVIQESLRLYPPSWLFDREAIADEEIGGFHIPAGSTILILPWIQHRRAAYWSEPERFDPDRFCPGREKERPAYAFCPFGGGPRVCIGNRFAIIESQVMLASLVRRYRFRLREGQSFSPLALIALRPRHGLWGTLSPAPSHPPLQVPA